ncbi:hypothetical protein DPEC_G00308880 [Dallia pectoralis]|uniref:Uncharacterized protein n=1 Tax=Dallia pectoralis TaxID=75939 RepID=A0ACC2FET6_DALPE|nr:hypothetical protein DPEC_G00308880 [Dallia pectoralis]
MSPRAQKTKQKKETQCRIEPSLRLPFCKIPRPRPYRAGANRPARESIATGSASPGLGLHNTGVEKRRFWSGCPANASLMLSVGRCLERDVLPLGGLERGKRRVGIWVAAHTQGGRAADSYLTHPKSEQDTLPPSPPSFFPLPPRYPNPY